MKRIAVIGSGDLGQLIAYHAENDKQANVVGFFDDFKETGETIQNLPILGGIDNVVKLYDKGAFDQIILGIGYKHFDFREEVFNRFYGKIKFATLIHSSCYVDSSCKIGEGVCLLPGSVLGSNVNIHHNVLINIGCTIAHDSVVQSHSFISPRVAIAGFVEVGEKCNIGINATLIDNIKISNNVQIGGGGVVISDINTKGLYVGNPVRFIR